MKNIMILSLMLFGFIAMAQEKNVRNEIVNNTVVSTYFYENGQVAQKGSYKEGKLDGSWVAYDESGKKTAMGFYEDGKKVGKWFFWTASGLNEVDYSDFRIASVTKWTQEEAIVNRN
uniref:toxin-antitoxin system YwqK family antitoxin n=1 Tax=Flavobacterium sp. TaxID=239 RepID=UPI00404A5B1F